MDHLLTGYLHPAYAASLAEFGEPIALPRSGGWLLKRPIPNTNFYDAMGCYPLFCCTDWMALAADLAELEDIVSVVVVTDPFGKYDIPLLEKVFPDLHFLYKEHFVTHLPTPLEQILNKHHRYYLRQALKSVRIAVYTDVSFLLEEWLQLYAVLIERHQLGGMHAFSRQAFEQQLQIPGMVALVAYEQEQVISAHLWYQQGQQVYSHLAASSPRGYELMASYAIYATAIEYFAQYAEWLHLGAGAGASQSGEGLTRFKRGWSTHTRAVYLGGRVLHPQTYEALCHQTHTQTTAYFPAYRYGEYS